VKGTPWQGLHRGGTSNPGRKKESSNRRIREAFFLSNKKKKNPKGKSEVKGEEISWPSSKRERATTRSSPREVWRRQGGQLIEDNKKKIRER